MKTEKPQKVTITVTTPEKLWVDHCSTFNTEPDDLDGVYEYIRADIAEKKIEGLTQIIDSQKQTHDALIKKIEKLKQDIYEERVLMKARHGKLLELENDLIRKMKDE